MSKRNRKFESASGLDQVLSVLQDMEERVRDMVNEVLPRRRFASIDMGITQDEDGIDEVVFSCDAEDEYSSRSPEEVFYITIKLIDGMFVVQGDNEEDECDTIEDVKKSVLDMVESSVDAW